MLPQHPKREIPSLPVGNLTKEPRGVSEPIHNAGALNGGEFPAHHQFQRFGQFVTGGCTRYRACKPASGTTQRPTDGGGDSQPRTRLHRKIPCSRAIYREAPCVPGFENTVLAFVLASETASAPAQRNTEMRRSRTGKCAFLLGTNRNRSRLLSSVCGPHADRRLLSDAGAKRTFVQIPANLLKRPIPAIRHRSAADGFQGPMMLL